MIAVAEALEIVAAACPAGPAVTIPLEQAHGRVLAGDLTADTDWPPFDTSAMDGYAVRAADAAAAGANLAERRGVVAAGDPAGPALAAGEAVRVMTGAPLPAGTEAIVPVEESEPLRESGRVVLKASARPGDHVRRRGESVSAGDVLRRRGLRLDPAALALAAMTGRDPIVVTALPRVAIAATGSELVDASESPGPARLRDSNGPMLSALCRAAGVLPVSRVTVGDVGGEVRRLFAEAGRREDVLVTSGGVSAGDLDLLPDAAREAGFELLFHGVAMRPGKPIAFGRRGTTLWFGLPGNPVSTSVAFHLFVRFALDLLQGASSAGAPRRQAVLTREIRNRGGRETYRDARLDADGGQLRATPLESRGSHDLAAHARADALVRIPAETAALASGSLVDCVVLER